MARYGMATETERAEKRAAQNVRSGRGMLGTRPRMVGPSIDEQLGRLAGMSRPRIAVPRPDPDPAERLREAFLQYAEGQVGGTGYTAARNLMMKARSSNPDTRAAALQAIRGAFGSGRSYDPARTAGVEGEAARVAREVDMTGAETVAGLEQMGEDRRAQLGIEARESSDKRAAHEAALDRAAEERRAQMGAYARIRTAQEGARRPVVARQQSAYQAIVPSDQPLEGQPSAFFLPKDPLNPATPPFSQPIVPRSELSAPEVNVNVDMLLEDIEHGNSLTGEDRAAFDAYIKETYGKSLDDLLARLKS